MPCMSHRKLQLLSPSVASQGLTAFSSLPSKAVISWYLQLRKGVQVARNFLGLPSQCSLDKSKLYHKTCGIIEAEFLPPWPNRTKPRDRPQPHLWLVSRTHIPAACRLPLDLYHTKNASTNGPTAKQKVHYMYTNIWSTLSNVTYTYLQGFLTYY